MFAKKSDLPEARIMRRRWWYLKDPVFLSEIGGALAFLGLLLAILVSGQRAAEEAVKPSAFEAHAFVAMLLITFGMMVSGGIMACMRVIVDAHPRSFIRHVGGMFASFAISMTLGTGALWGVSRLILPLQMFIAWLAMSAGFTLLIVMRRRQKAAEKKPPDDVRPVE